MAQTNPPPQVDVHAAPDARTPEAVVGGLVAGVDGSRDALQVLAWALAEAAAHQEVLHVVRAWTVIEAIPRAEVPFGIAPTVQECRRAIEQEVGHVIADARRSSACPDVEVVVHAVLGAPAPSLVAVARRARLLVVGHRGRGVLPLMLGSVTEHVLANARCPVAVVPLR
jgi:nucleotide-binding universal stress UspA family protein